MHYPKHIAIIPDGNRTWAKNNWHEQIAGHLEGQKTSIKLLKHIFEKTTVEVATIRWLSTENAKKRSQEELEYLYGIYKYALDQVDDLLKTMKISFRWIGSTIGMPQNVIELLQSRSEMHSYDSWKAMVLAMNYGWKDEIVRGVQKMMNAWVSSEDVTEETLWSYLDCWDLPPIDLVIRTKGKLAKRISWFMTRWIGYAELFFTNVLFPDFNEAELDKALVWYDSIKDERNFGE